MMTLYAIVFIGVFSSENSLFGIELTISSLAVLVVFLMGFLYGVSYLFFRYLRK